MATMTLRGVVIRYADLRFEREGAVFCRLHLQADLSGPVLAEMDWDAIPDGITTAKLTGKLTARTLTLTPSGKDLERHRIEIECSDVADFAVVPEKGEDGEVSSHRLNCIARSQEIGAISKVEQYRRLIGDGPATAHLAYEKQAGLFDAGTAEQQAGDSDDDQDEPTIGGPLFEAEDIVVDGETIHLASAVEVAGNSHELKQSKKRRRAAVVDELPAAEPSVGDGILRRLSRDHDGVHAVIDILEADGVLTWAASANVEADPEFGEMEIQREAGDAPPLAISHAVVAAANALEYWAKLAPAATPAEAKRGYADLIAWCAAVAGEARVEGRMSA